LGAVQTIEVGMELNTMLWLVVLDGVELGVDRQDGVCGVAKPTRQQPTTSNRGPVVWRDGDNK